MSALCSCPAWWAAALWASWAWERAPPLSMKGGPVPFYERIRVTLHSACPRTAFAPSSAPDRFINECIHQNTELHATTRQQSTVQLDDSRYNGSGPANLSVHLSNSSKMYQRVSPPPIRHITFFVVSKLFPDLDSVVNRHVTTFLLRLVEKAY